MPKKLLTSAALVAFLMGLAACSDDAEDPAGQGGDASAEQEGESPEMPEADVSDIPDVVADVEGEEISGDEFTAIYEGQFQQMAMQAQMTGEEPDQDELKSQTLDSMVGNELMIQDAADSGHEASKDEVDELLKNAAEEGGLESVDDLVASAEEQGQSEDQLRQDAHDQVLLEKVIDDLDVDEPSEDELRDLYDQSAAQQQGGEEGGGGEGSGGEESEMPSFEDAKPQLEEQAKQQAEQEALAQHAEDLREDADVETYLDS